MKLSTELKKYCNKIISDEIVSCKKHKWACQRFLTDLKRQKKKSFPYKFDEHKANKFLKWMQLFKHTKGPLAGTYKKPDIIEKFLFGQLYGWVFKKNGYRRFRNVYWQVARKNAKSQDLAIVGLYELAEFGEACSEVIVAATKKDQTKFVFNEADLIYQRSELLKDKFITKGGEILHPKSASSFSRFSKDDRKAGDGPNPQCGIIDEYHQQETDDNYNTLTSGMKNRVQPVLIIITTAGYELNYPCYRDEYIYISKILDPDNPVENDRYLALVCELDCDDNGELADDITDERNWGKSNPILAKTDEGIESIRAEIKIAQDKQEKLRDVLTKTFNIWVNMRDAGYMNLQKWKKCAGIIPDLKGLKCFVGEDLSSKIDLTSVGFEIPIDDKYIVLSHSFMPADTIKAKMKTDNVPYDRWVKEGWITLTPGAIVDYSYVEEYVIKQAEIYGFILHEFCLDPWGAVQTSINLKNKGYEVIEIVQGIKTLSEPTKDFRDMVYAGRVIHNNNPVLAWALGNAICEKIDRNENIILNKKKSKQRIDPASSLMNSHTRAMIPIVKKSGGVMFL